MSVLGSKGSNAADPAVRTRSRPDGRRPLCQASQVGAATRTGAERTQLDQSIREHRTAGATSLAERI
jgi:hypothetical protein